MMAVAVAPNRKRHNHLGIEVNQRLMWKGWEPGHEYTKLLVLKNVKVQTQKLKYSVPSTRFFSTIFPEPITLSAGTSFTLPVTFRPIEKNVYKDKIRFETNTGVFEVPICAVLPMYKVVLPEFVDLKICAVDNVVHAIFEIKNKSELETPYKWQFDGPFSVEPSEGVLEPHSIISSRISFAPKAALVYEGIAVCKYGLGYDHAQRTKLLGIGKYPHLVIRSDDRQNQTMDNLQACVAFGQVPIGESGERWITVQNLSKVDADFFIEYETGNRRLDSTFECMHRRGFVLANSSVRLKFMFTPNMVNATSVEYFTLQANGSPVMTLIKCTGSSKGPSVRLAAQLINFGRVDAGDSVRKVLTIINDSPVTAIVQFDIDSDESVYKFPDLLGKIQPNSSSKITIEFSPVHPINYHRRVTCLVHNQAPLLLDLIGTCHTEQVKPAVLRSRHVINYRRHVQRGLSTFPPEQLSEMLKAGKLEQDDIGALMYTEAEKLEQYCHPLVLVPAQDEYFNDGFHSDVVVPAQHVSTDVHVLDFGQCWRGLATIEPRTVNVTNHTRGHVTVVWMTSDNSVFSLNPVTAQIPPLKTTSFRVSFKPDTPNQFYASELEGYAFYKSLRDYRLVEQATQCPPWCLTLSCTGQTFSPNNVAFIPTCEIDSSKLIFPAVNVGESVYRTLLLYNTGQTPILYDFKPDPDGIFAVKPMKGIVKNGFQLFTVKCTPKEVKIYKNKIIAQLNGDEQNQQELLFYGSAESPQVIFPCDGEIYFRPTCIGTRSERQYAIRNVSRIPVRFEWKLTHEESQILAVKPRTGLIQPNESQNSLWSFRPSVEEKVVHKPKLIVWGQGQTVTSSGGKKVTFTVRAIGEGDSGVIQAKNVAFNVPKSKSNETYVDFGNVIVGTSAMQAFTICNLGNCDLKYRLLIEQSIEGAQVSANPHPCALELTTIVGVLPARAHTVVDAVVRPAYRAYYQFTVSYQILTPDGVTGPVSPPRHLCHLLATGVYPTMAVTDARCYGSATGISKKQLWDLFALDSLNSALDGDPSSPELKYSVQTRQCHRSRHNVYTRAIIDMNFAASPLGSEDATIYLMLENSGDVPVEFSFLFPSDLQIELEYWAETGDYDEDELHEMKVQDNHLFEVEPRHAVMTPGGSQAVTLTYRHLMTGTDRLPVLLKVNRGREVLLNFIGVTVEPGQPYVHFATNKHTFTPVPIGRQTTPKQVYQLYNGGSVPVRFEIDVEPFEQLRVENFDRYILKCLNPTGEIRPGRHQAVEFEFTPLEAQTYMIDVPIHVLSGATTLVTFTGIGYDDRLMGDTMAISDQMTLTGVPSTQTVVIPGQTCFLSTERLSFGNVPLFTHSRHVVFVMNKSRDHVISYTWYATNKRYQHLCDIRPCHGVVPPGESSMCRLIFTANDMPAFYDIDLVCEIVDETLKDAYVSDLEAWEKEKERQKVEFTITEKDLHADSRNDPEILYMPDPPFLPEHANKRISMPGARPSLAVTAPSIVNGKNNTLEAICRSNVEQDLLTKYRTLPPIRQLPAEAERYIRHFTATMTDLLWERPTAPEPFLLHLGVTARTHPIPEFQIYFPHKMRNFYIDRSLSSRMAPIHERDQVKDEDELSQPTQVIICTEEESDLISGTLANLLRSVLDDGEFRTAVECLRDEPIPYFQQFATSPYLHHSPSPPRSDTCSSQQVSESRASQVSDDKPEPEPELLSDDEPELERLKANVGNGHQPRDEPGHESTESVVPAPHPPTPTPHVLRSESEIEQAMAVERAYNEREVIKRLPEFGKLIEGIIENSLMNILTEAFSGEFSITSRPRVIALPPKPSSGGSVESLRSSGANQK